MYFVSLLVCVTAALAYSPQYAGKDWHAKPAIEKIVELSNRIEADATTPGWYSVQLAELFVEGMSKTFASSMDDMPAQNLFNLEERPKLIHTVGVVANMHFKPMDTKYNYTGVFASGCDGFVRMSLAKQPDSKPTSSSLIIPGIALKFIRDGHPSAQVFAMYSLDGQTSYNFFEHDLSNHVPNIDVNKADFASAQLYKVFKSESNHPTMLGLSDLAGIDANGKLYPQPNFPYRLIFHPTTRVHKHIPSTPISGDDYFVSQLSDSFFMGDLYEVYAQPTPLSPMSDYVQVGTVTLTGRGSGSRWGDHDMFFQHQKFEDDLELKPEWRSGAIKNEAYQAANYPYEFPDMPFK